MALKHKKMQIERQKCQMFITKEMSSSKDAKDSKQDETTRRK